MASAPLQSRMSGLDAPAAAVSLWRPVQASSMSFLHRNQTNAELVAILHKAIFQPEPPHNRVWLIASACEGLLTFVLCAVLVHKKKSLGKLWLMARRESPYGTFFVANSILVLLVGVAVYLIAWDLTALIVAGLSYYNISSFQWWWVIPLPWWPLVVGAYISIHGFVLSCSPRSPLSNLKTISPASSTNKWFYLPIMRSPAAVNTVLILPVLLFSISTFALVGMSANAYYAAEHLRDRILPIDIWHQVERFSRQPSVTFEGGESLASDELVWISRVVSAAYFEVHRYVSINLVVFTAAAFVVWIPCMVFALPNLASLLDHACSRRPEMLPVTCKGPLRKLFFLLKKGRTTSDKDTNILDANTWKMTILAVIYVAIMCVCVPSFAMVPLFMVVFSWPQAVADGNIIAPLSGATIAISIITFSSSTFFAVFCTVATLDPLLRAALGRNMIRTQIPIEICLRHHQSLHGESRLEHASPDLNLEGQGHSCRSSADLGLERAVTHKFSSNTMYSAKPTGSENDERGSHVYVTDLEARWRCKP